MNKNFLIEYHVLNKSGQILKAGKIKVKNKMNNLHAKIELEVFLKIKHPEFDRLVVISCVEDSDFMSMFGEIFNNPSFNDLTISHIHELYIKTLADKYLFDYHQPF